MSVWQPIETAPKDGTPFLSFSENAHRHEHLNVYGTRGSPILAMAWQPGDREPYPIDEIGDWHGFHHYSPSHWMPLPEPPVSA